MFFFVDNNYILTADKPTAARLAKIAKETGMMVMGRDQCREARKIDAQIHENFLSDAYLIYIAQLKALEG